MAYSAAERNDLQVKQNELRMLLDEIIKAEPDEHQAVTLTVIRQRMNGRGINQVATDALIVPYDALGTLMDS